MNLVLKTNHFLKMVQLQIENVILGKYQFMGKALVMATW